MFAKESLAQLLKFLPDLQGELIDALYENAFDLGEPVGPVIMDMDFVGCP